jgi:hypothetical protein
MQKIPFFSTKFSTEKNSTFKPYLVTVELMLRSTFVHSAPRPRLFPTLSRRHRRRNGVTGQHHCGPFCSQARILPFSLCHWAGLPDGIFIYLYTKNPYFYIGIMECSKQNKAINYIGVIYDNFESLWSFYIFCALLVHISPFWYVVPRKIWQPCCKILKQFFSF